MELLEQCQIWNENDEYQKIIDALEAVPAGERTPEMDSELARAYNNLAELGDRELFKKAIALLAPHEEYFEGDHCWNFRMGYSYYYLDQEGRALPYFRKALEARPGDEDMTAQEAQTANLIDEVVEKEQVESWMANQLAQLEKCGPVALAHIKQLILALENKHADYSHQLLAGLMSATQDCQQATHAFAEKAGVSFHNQ